MQKVFTFASHGKAGNAVLSDPVTSVRLDNGLGELSLLDNPGI